MEYISTTDAAKLWNISDRRVRVLCSTGKIPGAVKEGKTYRIPANAEKPADGRVKQCKHISSDKPERYLKWNDDIIGVISNDNTVQFTTPDYNNIVHFYSSLLNLDISEDEVSDILNQSGFMGYRFDGALEWIMKTIKMIKSL